LVTTLEGIITSCPTPLKSKSIRYRVSVTKVISPFPKDLGCQHIILTIKNASLDRLYPGDIIRFNARLKIIRNYNTYGSFNKILWWQEKGIEISAYCKNPFNVAVISRWQPTLLEVINPNIWPIPLEYLRFKILNKLQLGFSDNSFPLASALILGIKSSIPDNVRLLFSNLGIGHLLAISGLHMALIGFLFASVIYLIILLIPNALYYVNIRKTTCIITLIFLFIYCALTGFLPSATRAFIMILVFGIAYLWDISKDSLNTLAIAAWVILLLNPLSLFSISFQLSFIAVFFLVLSGKIFLKDIKLDGRLYTIVTEFLLVSLIAFISTLPLIVFYFNRVSLVSILANLIYVPIFSFLILPLLIISIISLIFCQHLSLYLWKIVSYLLNILLISMDHFNKLFNYSIWVIQPKLSAVIIYYLILLFICFVWIYNIKWKKFISVFGLIICLLILFSPRFHRFHGIKLYILDVGQGLCQVLEVPQQNKIMVVDAGPSFPGGFNTGKVVVAPFLRTIGYKTINILLCSHPERDHIGGMSPLLEEFQVKQFYYPANIYTRDRCWRQLLETIVKKQVKRTAIYKTTSINWGDIKIHIFPYNRTKTIKRRKRISNNEKGLVAEITYKNKRLLLCADINKKREYLLLKNKEMSKDIDVVVVPHHGSLSSSSIKFLKAIKPHIAIFSVGFKNYLHLPAQKILNRYKKLGASIYRTDKNGTICISISNTGKLQVTCFKNI